MMCLTPNTIRNPKGTYSDDGRDAFIRVPCRKCPNCKKRRASEWTFRLIQEDKIASSAAFMTYTYEDSELPISPNGLPTLNTKHHTDYMKRLRKLVAKQGYTQKLKYYMCGEYGDTTFRPHYHAILFNLPQDFIDNVEVLEQVWQKGIVTADKVSSNSIAYVTGYCNKKIKIAQDTITGSRYETDTGEMTDRVPEFSRMSKHLGESWLTDQRVRKLKRDLNPYVTVENGRKIALPSYYKRKALTKEEISLISNKTMEHMEQNPIFESEKHKSDTVHAQAQREKALSRQRNKI